jgi:actin
MFENFGVPYICIATDAILSLYAADKRTGVVVDSGYDTTNIVPIYEGCAIFSAIQRMNIGGNDLTKWLIQILSERGLPFETTAERELVRDIKEKLCYVAPEYNQEYYDHFYQTYSKKLYGFPSGDTLTIGTERFRCPEALFSPNLAGIDSKGLHDVIFSSIERCESGIQN